MKTPQSDLDKTVEEESKQRAIQIPEQKTQKRFCVMIRPIPIFTAQHPEGEYILETHEISNEKQTGQ